jgi:hypothetical protein
MKVIGLFIDSQCEFRNEQVEDSVTYRSRGIRILGIPVIRPSVVTIILFIGCRWWRAIAVSKVTKESGYNQEAELCNDQEKNHANSHHSAQVVHSHDIL